MTLLSLCSRRQAGVRSPYGSRSSFEQHVDRYEAWFERHRAAYESELEAIRELLPLGRGTEVGVGTGRFAARLGITSGAEPSALLRAVAHQRGINAMNGVAEALPYPDATFDLVLMVTTICFVDDLDVSLREARRVLRPDGHLVIGFVDRESALGHDYEAHKAENVFYREAPSSLPARSPTISNAWGLATSRSGRPSSRRWPTS